LKIRKREKVNWQTRTKKKRGEENWIVKLEKKRDAGKRGKDIFRNRERLGTCVERKGVVTTSKGGEMNVRQRDPSHSQMPLRLKGEGEAGVDKGRTKNMEGGVLQRTAKKTKSERKERKKRITFLPVKRGKGKGEKGISCLPRLGRNMIGKKPATAKGGGKGEGSSITGGGEGRVVPLRKRPWLG